MELSFSKQAKLETLDNFKYPKSDCCKQNFLKGYFYDVKFEWDADQVNTSFICHSINISSIFYYSSLHEVTKVNTCVFFYHAFLHLRHDFLTLL